MKLAPVASLLVAASLGCSSPAVWRAAEFGADKPAPTLMAAAAYDFNVHREVVDLTGIDLRLLDDIALAYAKEHSAEIIWGIASMKDEASAIAAATVAIQVQGPQMHEQAAAFLASQGFALEYDDARAQRLIGGGTVAGEYAYVVPKTAANPFGMDSDEHGEPGDFPMFLAGSKRDTAERLATQRPREAYASVHAIFSAPDNYTTKGVTCLLIIQVLDQVGELAFEGRATATVAGGAPGDVIPRAFDAALAQMAQPVIQAQ